MYCAQCGTESQDGGDTCDVCGSPMSPRSGPEHCPACSAPISAYDRYCQSCGNSLTAGTVSRPGRYAPGPSFVDDDPLDIDPTELPPWLRDITPATTRATAIEEPAAVGLVDERLPEWLQAERPAAYHADVEETAAAPAAALSDAPSVAGEPFSLIGEDDLPEWLRALGEEEPAAAPSPPLSHIDVLPDVSQTPALQAPSVGRAWLVRPRLVDPAAVEEARHEFVPLGEDVAVAVQSSEVEPVAAAPAPMAEPVAMEADTDAALAAPRTRRIRFLILILALVVLALLVYIYLGSPSI